MQVIDLLNSNQRTYLAVRWSRHKGFYVENLFHVECESIEDLFAVLEEGRRCSAVCWVFSINQSIYFVTQTQSICCLYGLHQCFPVSVHAATLMGASSVRYVRCHD